MANPPKPITAAVLIDRRRTGRSGIYGMDDEQQVTSPVIAPSDPPMRPRRRWPLAVGVVVIVLALAAAGAAIGFQRSQLNSTRSDLAALRATESSDVAGLKQTVVAQQHQIATVTGQLSAAQAQLKGAQQRLTNDEQQLKLTDQRLPPDLTALAAKVSPSVVFVSCFDASGNGGIGTAFALDLPTANGSLTTLVTAAHVIADCADPAAGGSLVVSSGSQSWPATVRGEDLTNDVAMLNTAAKVPALKPASSDPTVGEFVMVVGNPLGVINNVTSGNVSQLDGPLIYYSAPTSNGNSGGPVVDKDGDAIGIVDAGYAATTNAPLVQNLNISVRMSALCASILSGAACSSLH